MFSIGDTVQIINHSEPECNKHYGTIVDINVSYGGERYYKVELWEYSQRYCDCTGDELLEG